MSRRQLLVDAIQRSRPTVDGVWQRRAEKAERERDEWKEAHLVQKTAREDLNDKLESAEATLERLSVLAAEIPDQYCLAHHHPTRVEEALCSLTFQRDILKSQLKSQKERS